MNITWHITIADEPLADMICGITREDMMFTSDHQRMHRVTYHGILGNSQRELLYGDIKFCKVCVSRLPLVELGDTEL